jgi:hypothetical protein
MQISRAVRPLLSVISSKSQPTLQVQQRVLELCGRRFLIHVFETYLFHEKSAHVLVPSVGPCVLQLGNEVTHVQENLACKPQQLVEERRTKNILLLGPSKSAGVSINFLTSFRRTSPV